MGLEIKLLTRLQIIRYCEKLEKENKKLKEDNRFLTKISKEYMKKENIVEVAEFTELYKYDLEKKNINLTKCNLNLQEHIDKVEEENKSLKDKIEFLTNCLDDRDKSIELMKHKNELQEKALIKLCLKHHYDSIIIGGEEVIDMSNYKVVENRKPQEEKLF